MKLIDAGVLIAACKEIAKIDWNKRAAPVSWSDAYEGFIDTIEEIPTIDAVPVGVLDQVRWERDVAIAQLNDYGVSFGEKADCVRVTRCKDCKYTREMSECEKRVYCEGCLVCLSPEASVEGYNIVFPEDFCSYGERRSE